MSEPIQISRRDALKVAAVAPLAGVARSPEVERSRSGRCGTDPVHSDDDAVALSFRRDWGRLVAGLIGMGMVMYAKSTHRLIPLAAGVGLMTCPYFVPNTAVLVALCAALTAVPIFLRNA